MLEITTLLATAFLFGGMVLFSFGFAAFLFTNLPADDAGMLLRRAFPHFYLWCIALAALCAALWYLQNELGAALLAVVALTTIPARQVLMPAINAATDAGNKRRFNQLHGLSVVITLAHIGLVAYALTLLL